MFDFPSDIITNKHFQFQNQRRPSGDYAYYDLDNEKFVVRMPDEDLHQFFPKLLGLDARELRGSIPAILRPKSENQVKKEDKNGRHKKEENPQEFDGANENSGLLYYESSDDMCSELADIDITPPGSEITRPPQRKGEKKPGIKIQLTYYDSSDDDRRSPQLALCRSKTKQQRKEEKKAARKKKKEEEKSWMQWESEQIRETNRKDEDSEYRSHCIKSE